MNKDEVMVQLEELNKGETLLVGVTKANSKHGDNLVKLEFAEKIDSPTAGIGENSVNVLSLLNKSSTGFSPSKSRRGWLVANAKDIAEQMPSIKEEVEKADEEITYIGMKNPVISGNVRLRVRVAETQEMDEWTQVQLEEGNFKPCKLNPTTNKYLVAKGKPIFGKTEVVGMVGDEAPKHSYIIHDAEVEESALSSVNVEETVEDVNSPTAPMG